MDLTIKSPIVYKMHVDVSKDVGTKIERMSGIMGIGKKELVDRAILTYIDSVSRFLELKKEFREWDELSDEALLNFEKSL